ncbi:M56 family metallopeptidase [Marinicella sp. W31]|uniref:M56 family metallopeptidase n=1 Tax=Marinicella sp. W31 TaxID=3023713 RepID=UPI003756548B
MYVLIQITLVALICWLLILALKHTRPHIVQKFISSSLILCLVIPILAKFNTPFQVQATFDSQSEISESQQLNTPVQKQQQPEVKTQVTPPKKQLKNNTISDFNWPAALLMMWLFGFLIMLFRHSISLFRVRQLLKKAKPFDFEFKLGFKIRKKINLMHHRDAKIPFLYVSSEIFIVLPNRAHQWDASHLKDVILHELCHYRRKDHWLVWLSLLISALYWFHPLIRLLLVKQRQYIELACDQQLLADGLDKHHYAESLMLVTHDFKHNQSVIGMATEPHLLSSRIQGIISATSKKPSIRQKCAVILGTVCLITTGCIKLDHNDSLDIDNMIQLVSHDLPLLRSEKVPKGDLHLSAFYDGHDRQNTYLHLQLENQDKRKTWVRLGPLKKFTEHIHTWHFKLSEGVELTGQYKISGVEPDGVVDGIAIGLVSLSHSGEFKILKTQGPIVGEVPNVLCSWPLWMGERKFNKVLPQMTYSKPESVQRLLCGSQLMGNGEYAFSF